MIIIRRRAGRRLDSPPRAPARELQRLGLRERNPALLENLDDRLVLATGETVKEQPVTVLFHREAGVLVVMRRASALSLGIRLGEPEPIELSRDRPDRRVLHRRRWNCVLVTSGLVHNPKDCNAAADKPQIYAYAGVSVGLQLAAMGRDEPTARPAEPRRRRRPTQRAHTLRRIPGHEEEPGAHGVKGGRPRGRTSSDSTPRPRRRGRSPAGVARTAASRRPRTAAPDPRSPRVGAESLIESARIRIPTPRGFDLRFGSSADCVRAPRRPAGPTKRIARVPAFFRLA